ncbi:hypothetical protein E3U47_03275 [Pseudomonas sp. RIT623]|nr:hypothetical protein E3U47_03275 [Pseudomonas sp. RIT623]
MCRLNYRALRSKSKNKSKEQRAKSKEQRAKSKEQRAKSKEQSNLALSLGPSFPLTGKPARAG